MAYLWLEFCMECALAIFEAIVHSAAKLKVPPHLPGRREIFFNFIFKAQSKEVEYQIKYSDINKLIIN